MDYQKYKTILDNLLNINRSDSSIFTQIKRNAAGETNFFDLYKLFGAENFDYILKNDNFKFHLIEQFLLKAYDIAQKVSDLPTLQKLIEKLHQHQILKGSAFLKQEYPFLETKEKLTEHLQRLIQKSLFNWKRIKDFSETTLEETNMWPLHIGFLMVSLRKEEKAIYAPLIFKEVQIENEKGNLFLSSNGEIKVNEKLLFLLNNYGFSINIESILEQENKIFNIIEKIKEKWKDVYHLPEDIIMPFDQFKNEDITNVNIKFHGGAVLGIFQPSGGYARNRMKQIIENNELESIIDVEINKNKYQDFVDQNIFNPQKSIIRLTASNLSQDKAIISALNQHTIIWGPPGTGKSQTIVNLIINILINNKTAIVGSQKRVALEVIKKRMNELSMFCLFVLNSKNKRKREFYKPIKEYLHQIEYFRGQTQNHFPALVSESEIEWANKVKGLIDNSQTKEAFEAIYYLNDHKKDFNGEKDILLAAQLPKNVIFPDKIEYGLTSKKLLNLAKLKFPLSRKYRTLKKLGNKLDEEFIGFEGNLNELANKFKNLSPYEWWLNDYSNPLYAIKDLNSKFKNLTNPAETINSQEIKNIILQRINQRLDQLTIEEKRMYKEFSASVRIKNLTPQRFVKRYASIIKKVFPIVIATPDSDLSGWNKEEFDYGILDESSQIFIENGLTLLYLAKTKILAGDQMQMRPSNWFGIRVTDDTIYGQVDSMLDYCMGLGVYQVLLNKNYRSDYASLMTFSSKTFYNSKLDVVDKANNKTQNPIEVHEVDGIWDDNKNELEGDLALKITKEQLSNYSKIILLAFNAKQFDYLKEQIFLHYPELEEASQNDKLMVKNLENIQGDEADLVIATVAYDKNAKLTSTYVARSGGKNALNVAITRAKEKIIVIKSIKSYEVNITPTSSEDLIIFKNWLEFLESSPQRRLNLLNESFIKNKQDIISSPSKQWFENILTKKLEQIFFEPEFKILRNYCIGSLTIDYIITYNDIIYKCLIVDVFEYENGYADFASVKDKMKFLASKKYDAFLVNPLNYLDMIKKFKWWVKYAKTPFLKENNQDKKVY
ncbi:AAA domain-containing protein [Mycoplasmopsis citelli]|uniref:DEAD/DEAH box helicase n=1 Tax=Mycoplasmopsis citelli TaxID=171281 RepID=UPI0021151FEE|nr:DEAD/DEAH box helicase [Mycoplasmopsis citelli]UUD35791.1 AAA domain-containing protein [Mycoplasmopsis citelli]